MPNKWKALPLSLLLIANFIFTACSTTEKTSDTPEGAYAIAEEYEKDELYEEAIRRYNDVKNRFPYSNYATKAKLAVGNVYFKQESYLEAQLAYQNFRELHPTHPETDYVTYRIGLCYFNQLPTSIDRDLSAAHDAITTFNELEKKFPKSSFLSEAGEKRDRAAKMLAEKELYIANYYFKQNKYESALSRYESILKNHSSQGFDSEALSKASVSAHRLGLPKKAQDLFAVLKERYPNGEDTQFAKGEIEEK